jgi:hypothetical protein
MDNCDAGRSAGDNWPLTVAGQDCRRLYDWASGLNDGPTAFRRAVMRTLEDGHPVPPETVEQLLGDPEYAAAFIKSALERWSMMTCLDEHLDDISEYDLEAAFGPLGCYPLPDL